MAEPVDYFMQGVGLGQRSRSIRNQEDQFRTNLAERARQFDLSNDIAQSNLQLRQKEFTLQQENSVIDNRYKTANSIRLEAANQTNKRLADEAVQFAPNLSSYNDELNLWDGLGAVPKIPSGLPLAQRKEAESMRDGAIEASKVDEYVRIQKEWNATQQKIWIEDYNWAKENAPNLITSNERGEPYYDPKQVQTARKQMAAYKAMVFGQTGLSPDTFVVETDLGGGRKSRATFKQPEPKATVRTQLLGKNISDFMDEDGNFNRDAFEEALKALTPLRTNEASVNNTTIDFNRLRNPRTPREEGDPTATEMNRP
tara:strand:- start:8038 stop:8976 length:939 start_codon:yes stop_codon:yes gene_type:complete